jgi:hypothetical protein
MDDKSKIKIDESCTLPFLLNWMRLCCLLNEILPWSCRFIFKPRKLTQKEIEHGQKIDYLAKKLEKARIETGHDTIYNMLCDTSLWGEEIVDVEQFVRGGMKRIEES